MKIFLLDMEAQNSISKIKKCVLQNNITLIIPLARKGDLFFKYLTDFDKNFEKELREMNVSIISDRTINKQGNYDELRGKKILLLDDSVKTGNHFIHTANYLRNKINKNVLFNEEDFDFFYYAHIRCKDINLNNKIDQSKLCVCRDGVSIQEYFDFCHNESIYSQKQLIPTSSDLPVFEVNVRNILGLKSILLNISDFEFAETSFRIANHKFDLGVLILDDNILKKILGEFLISAACKIRYEFDSDDNVYKFLFTPFAICDSIRYEELENLYNLIFDDFINAKTKTDMNCTFVQLYRDIVYLFSYFIGDAIKKHLKEYNIFLEYRKNSDYDKKNFKALKKYNENGIISFFNENFYYTSKAHNPKSLAYSLEQIKIKLYDTVVRNKSVHNVEMYGQYDYDYDYNFIELNSLSGIYKNSSNKLPFVTSLFIFLENYSMTNEIEFNLGDHWVERGLYAGELSISNLPIYDQIFYTGLKYFYEKINKNYQIYRKYYDDFIEQFFIFLRDEDYFHSPYLSMSQFQYLADYYRNIDKNSFNLIVESKSYLFNLNDEKNVNIINWLNFLSNCKDIEGYK